MYTIYILRFLNTNQFAHSSPPSQIHLVTVSIRITADKQIKIIEQKQRNETNQNKSTFSFLWWRMIWVERKMRVAEEEEEDVAVAAAVATFVVKCRQAKSSPNQSDGFICIIVIYD